MAEARLGIRFVNRQSSTALSSTSVSMICSRSPRVILPTGCSPWFQGSHVGTTLLMCQDHKSTVRHNLLIRLVR